MNSVVVMRNLRYDSLEARGGMDSLRCREERARMLDYRTGMALMLSLFSAAAVFTINAQSKPAQTKSAQGAAPPNTVEVKTLAERLGYARDAKLIIVHADDVGVTHSVNAATVTALNDGLVNSASIMVPCPWFPEIADYAKAHQDLDFGLHLTLTSERVYYRWGPVAPRDKVPSLVDENGYFHHDWQPNTHIDPKDVEVELRAQIDRALAMGVRPTHLDSHQYRLIETNKELFEVFVRLAHEYRLPFFVTRDWFAQHPYLQASLGPNDVVIDHTVTIEPSVTAENWGNFYSAALRNLQPGVTEFVIHVAYDNDEMKAATRERATWGAAWRQRDFDYFTSNEFKVLLEQLHIKLVTWREIGQLQPH